MPLKLDMLISKEKHIPTEYNSCCGRILLSRLTPTHFCVCSCSPKQSLRPSEFTQQSHKQPSASAAAVEQSHHNTDSYVSRVKAAGANAQHLWFIVTQNMMLPFRVSLSKAFCQVNWKLLRP